ncbi:MAG TPA: ferritin-like domain-containing protein [Jiangellaceae bacterium]|nr:ferritin-like domain-containing protein [Jiangellaceae bacterium]
MSITDALQAALAGEHACVYGYGLVGAHAGTRDEPAARAAYESHRARRDLLAAQLRARRAEPVAALPAYGVPFAVTDAVTASRLAGLLEERLAPLYADLVAVAANPVLREQAARALVETSVRSAGWTGGIRALPGLDPVPD